MSLEYPKYKDRKIQLSHMNVGTDVKLTLIGEALGIGYIKNNNFF